MIAYSTFIKASHISILKTLLLNYCYFGFNGLFKPRLIVSRNCLLKNTKGDVTIEKGCKVFLGFENNGFNDYKNERLIWDVNGKMVFKGNATFYPGCKIICMKNGQIEFGKGFSCNTNTKIICNKSITFGNDCLVSWDCTFLDTDFHKVFIDSIRLNEDRSISIGNHVWICCESLVLKGASVPDNSVIGARSVLSSKLYEENTVYYNYSVKKGIHWEK